MNNLRDQALLRVRDDLEGCQEATLREAENYTNAYFDFVDKLGCPVFLNDGQIQSLYRYTVDLFGAPVRGPQRMRTALRRIRRVMGWAWDDLDYSGDRPHTAKAHRTAKASSPERLVHGYRVHASTFGTADSTLRRWASDENALRKRPWREFALRGYDAAGPGALRPAAPHEG